METSQPTAVLVHGAWHDEHCWTDVMAQLALRRTPSVSLTLPSTDPGRELPGFADDVAAVVELIESLDGEVTLCGHGYGGMVISEAGNHDQVSHLVYLAAFCPTPGQRVIDQAAGPPVGPFAVRQTGDGRMTVQPRLAARRFYGDLDPGAAAIRASRLLPSTAAIHRARSANPAWLAKATTYVLCRRDRVLSRRRSRLMALQVVRTQLARGRTGNHAVTLGTGHCPFYSAPGLVADVLVGISPSWPSQHSSTQHR